MDVTEIPFRRLVAWMGWTVACLVAFIWLAIDLPGFAPAVAVYAFLTVFRPFDRVRITDADIEALLRG